MSPKKIVNNPKTKPKANIQVYGNSLNFMTTQHPTTFDAKAEAICQDYAKKFHGDVLRWRIEQDQNVLVILFMDGRKFYFPIPEGWRKAS